MITASMKFTCDVCLRDHCTSIIGQYASPKLFDLPYGWAAEIQFTPEGGTIKIHGCRQCKADGSFKRLTQNLIDAIRVRSKDRRDGDIIAIVVEQFSGLACDYRVGEIVMANISKEDNPDIKRNAVVSRPMNSDEVEFEKKRGSLLRTKNTIVGIPTSYLRMLMQ